MAEKKVKIVIEVNSKELRDDLKKAGKDVGGFTDKGTKQVKKMNAAWASFVGNVGANILTNSLSSATSAIKDFALESITAASNATETIQKFNVVFKDVRAEADKTADNLVKNFGLAGSEARDLLSNTGDLLAGFGFTGQAALDMSKQVQELAVDLASFKNVEGGATLASEALTKGLLGETESLKSLGIAILQEDVKKQIAINTANGLTFSTLRQAKAQATLDLAIQQSGNAIGDFERSSGSFANQMKILNSRMLTLKETFGQIVVENPEVLKAFTNLNDNLAGYAKDLRDPISKTSKLLSLFIKIANVTGLFNTRTKNLKDEMEDLEFSGDFGLVDLDMATKRIQTIRNELDETFGTGSLLFRDQIKGAEDLSGALNKIPGMLEVDVNFKVVGDDIGFDAGDKPDIKAGKNEKKKQEVITAAMIQAQAVRDQIKLEFNEADAEIQDELRETDLEKLTDFESQKLQIQFDAKEAEIMLQQNTDERKGKLELLKEQKTFALQSVFIKKKKKQDADATKNKIANDNARLTSTGNFISAGLILAKNGSKEQKKLRIAETIISTYKGATDAFADPTVPSIAARIALSASVVAMGLANLHQITSAGSFEHGGIIGGNSFAGDNLQANVNSGEMILNRGQQTELFSLANGSGFGNNTSNEILLNIADMIQAQGSNSVSIDGEELNDSLQEIDERRLN